MHADLVFDVGLHRGEDTAFYLAMGYRVVAFEANPDLVDLCSGRFSTEIGHGRLSIVGGAVAAGQEHSVTFFRHPYSAWGTTRGEWLTRNDRHGRSNALEVPRVDFARAIREHGMPHYLKIDIEGSDRVCLEALRAFRERPAYVSLEADKTRFDDLVAEFDLLEELGYARFAVVQQAGLQTRRTPATRVDGTRVGYKFEPDASGSFGEDVGPWGGREEALAAYRRIFRRYKWFGDHSMLQRTVGGRILRGQMEKRIKRPLPGWYDTHARLPDRLLTDRPGNPDGMS